MRLGPTGPMAKLLPSAATLASLGTPPSVSGGSLPTKGCLFPRLEQVRASDLLPETVFSLAAPDPASLAAFRRLFRMVLPLPVLVFRDLGSDSFLDSRRRNMSFGAFIIIGTVIVQVLVDFQICCSRFTTTAKIVP